MKRLSILIMIYFLDHKWGKYLLIVIQPTNMSDTRKDIEKEKKTTRWSKFWGFSARNQGIA